MSTVSADVLRDLAPTGTLRASINLGNIVLAQGTPENPGGVTPELARELARRLGVPVALSCFDGAGKAFEAMKAGKVDIVFLAIEPVRAATGGCCAMIDQFRAEKLDAVAGVKQPLVEYAKTHSDVRVMDGRFQEIRQAMGTPKGRMAAVAYLRTFIEEMKASGFVADALKRSNQPDAQVAPAGG